MAYERQSVGGRLGNHNVAPYLLTDVHESCIGPSAIDFVVPAHPSWASNYLLHSGTLPPESLSAASADFAFLAVSPRAVATRPRLRETFDSCVMLLLRASSALCQAPSLPSTFFRTDCAMTAPVSISGDGWLPRTNRSAPVVVEHG